MSSSAKTNSVHAACITRWLRPSMTNRIISYRIPGPKQRGPITITLVTQTPADHMRALVAGLQDLEEKLRLGGGAKKIAKQHKEGKLTARERVAKVIDPGTFFLEIGLLVAHDKYDGQAPAAGVVTRSEEHTSELQSLI